MYLYIHRGVEDMRFFFVRRSILTRQHQMVIMHDFLNYSSVRMMHRSSVVLSALAW